MVANTVFDATCAEICVGGSTPSYAVVKFPRALDIREYTP